MQAVGDIAIVMHYPVKGGPMENLPHSTEDLDVVFHDTSSSKVMPRIEDKLQRTPLELKRMVQMYLP